MSQEFRSLPQSFLAAQDNELLVVGATPTRMSLKSFRYDNLVELKFLYPGDQDYSLGTTNTWANIPFNSSDLTGSEAWTTLNADGSFTLVAGLYLLEAHILLGNGGTIRLGLNLSGSFLEITHGNAITAYSARTRLLLTKKFASVGDTYRLQVAASDANCKLATADTFLAGKQSTIATCQIIKLG